MLITGYIHQSIVQEVKKEESISMQQDKKVMEKPEESLSKEEVKKEIPRVEKAKELSPKIEKEPAAKPVYSMPDKKRYESRRRTQQKRLSFKAGLGLAIPSGDIADLFNLGLGIELSGRYLILLSPQMCLLWGLEGYYFLRESGLADVSMSRLLFYGDIRLGQKIETFGIFAQGGLGLYLDILSLESYWYSDTDSEFVIGPRIGGGISIGRFEILGLFHLPERKMFTVMFSFAF